MQVWKPSPRASCVKVCSMTWPVGNLKRFSPDEVLCCVLGHCDNEAPPNLNGCISL